LLGIAGLLLVTSTSCRHHAGGSHPAVIVRIVGNPLGNPDSFYKPSTVHVRVGQTVEWVDRDDSDHTVTPEPSTRAWSGGSPVLSTGKSYRFRFTRPGSYRYHCMVHPNMLGFVVVTR